MKLLLTSSGLRNQAMIDSLDKLLGKSVKNASVVHVPTASNFFTDSNARIKVYEKDLEKLFKKIQTVELENLSKDDILKLKNSDIIYVSGGNPFYLLYWIRKSGFDKILKKLLLTKIYIGDSSGSMVLGRSLIIKPKPLSEKYLVNGSTQALSIVNFNIETHYTKEKYNAITRLAKEFDADIYGLDDQSAILVSGKNISLVGGKKWVYINKTLIK